MVHQLNHFFPYYKIPERLTRVPEELIAPQSLAQFGQDLGFRQIEKDRFVQPGAVCIAAQVQVVKTWRNGYQPNLRRSGFHIPETSDPDRQAPFLEAVTTEQFKYPV